ncbi:HAMP domain-containing histidine kinase [Roseomonas eburnea]|uniref:Signal transduction histidine-protein kinase/phosphatase MprB n=1 Tax=Neoroseomonas eburnea TaxID=1346889 RepID=A0A9X9X900_9PROT|nr:HAMP domain-containing sensor histidine kinase [Neoroseomonas eburnea]MBR0680186.1 HAMP domain-containing histidine kinase [Neoroseomonas eburnea]
MASATATGTKAERVPPVLRRKPRILTVLLLVNLVLLALPLGGLWMLRLYESALVRQTETELVAQAAVIAATHRAGWLREAGPEAPALLARLPAAAPQPEGWAPRFATLDLARDPILPPPPDAAPPAHPADPVASAAGAALAPVLAEAQRVTLAAMRVTDGAGVVVASTGGEGGLSLRGLEEVAAALAGQPAARVRARREAVAAGAGAISRDAPFRVFVALPVQQGGHVIGAVLLSRTPSSIRQALHGKRWELAALTLAMLLVAAALAGFTAYTVSRPIRAVADQARAVASGARVEVQRVRRSAVREADELAAAIGGMAGTLERRATYISEFAAAVSHEFKTPLAALRGALELLQDHGPTMTEAERAAFLAQCMDDVLRLDRLVTRLLDLARAEAPHPHAPGRAEVGQAVRDAAEPHVAAGLEIAFEGRPDAEAAIAPEALRSIFAILFENVRQHAGEGARCHVSCEATGDRLRIRVSDTGRGISAANSARVFERFFTTAREAGGTGLGLAIARSLAEAGDGQLDLVSGTGGTVLELNLPRASATPRTSLEGIVSRPASPRTGKGP